MIEEIQDNNGTSTAGTTAADATWANLIAAIDAHPDGPTYQYRQIDPEAGADGGAPGGNIRVGFLFNPDAGVAFVDRGTADFDDANSVVDAAGVPDSGSARAASIRRTQRSTPAASRSSASSPSRARRSSSSATTGTRRAATIPATAAGSHRTA